MLALQLVTCAALGALGRRVSGGWIEDQFGSTMGGTGVVRVLYGLLLAVAVVLTLMLERLALPNASDIILAAGTVLLTFAGSTAGFPRAYIRWFGRVPVLWLNFDPKVSCMAPVNLVETVGLSISGLAATVPLAFGALMLGLPWWWIVLAGLSRGATFWLATLWLPYWRWAGVLNRDGIREPTAMNEIYAGATLGMAVAFTVRPATYLPVLDAWIEQFRSLSG